MKSNTKAIRHFHWTGLNLLVGLLFMGANTWAQDRSEEEQSDAKKAETDVEREMQERTDDRSEERPEPPGGTALDENLEVDVDAEEQRVVRGAGMGSDIAYASKGVVELGGAFALDIRDEFFELTIAPTLGYFIIDRLELTLIPLFRINNINENLGDSGTNVRIAAVLEPSYHLPFTDYLYGFVGMGVGITYEEGPGVDLLLRPVLGLDIMVGRSGIFKPAGFMDVGIGNGAIGGGFQAGYTVMF